MNPYEDIRAKQAAYQQSGALLNPNQAQATKPQPLGRLSISLDMMHQASALVAETADRLCGGSLAEGNPGEAQGFGPGIFNEIESAASQIQAIAEQITSDMGRIQSRL